jgi:hypothetical protein
MFLGVSSDCGLSQIAAVEEDRKHEESERSNPVHRLGKAGMIVVQA